MTEQEIRDYLKNNKIEPYKLKNKCEGNLLGYGECNNKPMGSIGQFDEKMMRENGRLVTTANFDICMDCYMKTFPNSTIGRD